jgi:DUF1680 family protein
VYCIESTDLKNDNSVFALALSKNSSFKTLPSRIGSAEVMTLETVAKKISDSNWDGQLYREISKEPAEEIKIRLVPYYAWGNRGHSEMTVWLPVR